MEEEKERSRQKLQSMGEEKQKAEELLKVKEAEAERLVKEVQTVSERLREAEEARRQLQLKASARTGVQEEQEVQLSKRRS